MDVIYFCLILSGLLYGTQCAAVIELGQAPEVFDAAKYERLLGRFLHQSTAARQNTPPFTEAGSVAVKYGMSLIDVREVNAETGVVELLVWEQMTWNDNRLTWDPEEYGGIEDLRVPPAMLWKPDVLTYNSFMTADIETRTDVNAVVNSEGDVTYIPPSYKKIRCDMNEDGSVASCKLKVGSWTFNGNQLDLNFYDAAALDVSNFHTNRLVPNIANNVAARNVVIYECCPEEYIDLTFNFDIVLGGDAEDDGGDGVAEPANADEEQANMESA